MKKSMLQITMIIPIILLLCITFGCQNQATKAELEEFKAQAEVEEQNKELVKRFYEAANKGDSEALGEVLAPEYVWYVPSRNPESISREGAIEFIKMLHNAFPDITYSIEELIAVEDIVISRFIVRGTHEGEFEGIPATGNKFESGGILITRIENGKIVEDKEEVDLLGLMMQLGMELKPKEEEK